MNKKYRLHWLDRTEEVIEGIDLKDAFNNAGIGNGALSALDYYELIQEFINPVVIEYCPECGNNKYIKGKECIECGFPHHYLFPEQVYPDPDLYDNWM